MPKPTTLNRFPLAGRQDRSAAAFHASSRLCCPLPAETVNWPNARTSAPLYRRDSAACSTFTRPSSREHAPEKFITLTRQIPSRRRDRLLLHPISPNSQRPCRRVAWVPSEEPGRLVAATGFGSDSVERARWMKSCKASRSLASWPVASAWEACRPGASPMIRPMQ